MALTQRLQLRQTQALVMTPQLMQAIKLLQLSNLDLAAYVDRELERNPLLERASEDEAPAADAERDGATEAEEERRPSDWVDQDLETSRSAMENRLGTDLDNVFPEDGGAAASSRSSQEAPAAYSEWAGVGSGGREDGDYNLEAFVSAELTLADHLAEQLALATSDPVRRIWWTRPATSPASCLRSPRSSARHSPKWRRCLPCCRASSPRACARAT